jgi:hypothetical protein
MLLQFVDTQARHFWRREDPVKEQQATWRVTQNQGPTAAKLFVVRRFFILLLLLPWAAPVKSQPVTGNVQPAPRAGDTLPSAQAQALVTRALANEFRAAQDTSHPLRYQLHKTSPRLTTTKEIYETRDGDVARLVAINDKPLSAADEQKEEARLDALISDPGRQRHRKQAEDTDAGRALKVLRALPSAFVYQYVGSDVGPQGNVEKFTFRPDPNFSPKDLETQVLTEMAGEIWIDGAHERVVRLQGHLQQNVDFGWGILGRLNRGGWIVIEQADVGEGQWRAVRFQMAMSGRVVFKYRTFDTTEEESRFAPVPAGLSYQQAIKLLREDPR